jgi:hypothetical protein
MTYKGGQQCAQRRQRSCPDPAQWMELHENMWYFNVLDLSNLDACSVHLASAVRALYGELAKQASISRWTQDSDVPYYFSSLNFCSEQAASTTWLP